MWNCERKILHAEVKCGGEKKVRRKNMVALGKNVEVLGKNVVVPREIVEVLGKKVEVP